MKQILLFLILVSSINTTEICDINSKNNPKWCPNKNFNWNIAISLCQSLNKDGIKYYLPIKKTIIANKDGLHLRCVGDKK